MTVYSGFSTRKLEQRYNNLMTEVLELFSQIIITYVQRNKIEPFERQFKKLYTSIEKMDTLKYLQPKFSVVLKPISEHIIFFEQRPETVPESVINYQQIVQKKRPLTGNNFIQQKGHSIQLERRTINTVNQKSRTTPLRYERNERNRARNQSFSVKHSGNYGGFKQEKQFQLQIPSSVTMEELMEKNRLVERKMTLFRKKRHIQPVKISKIPELEEEQQAA